MNVEVTPELEFPSPKSTLADRKAAPVAGLVAGHCTVKVTGRGACPLDGEGTTEQLGATWATAPMEIEREARQKQTSIRATARTKLIATPGETESRKREGKLRRNREPAATGVLAKVPQAQSRNSAVHSTTIQFRNRC